MGEADEIYFYDWNDDCYTDARCCWCKKTIIFHRVNSKWKPFNSDGTPHDCCKMDSKEHRLDIKETIALIKRNFKDRL